MMSKFLVGTQENYQPMFDWHDEKVNGFQNELRAEVRKFFKEAKIDSKISNLRLTQLFVCLFITAYITYFHYWAGMLLKILSVIKDKIINHCFTIDLLY